MNDNEPEFYVKMVVSSLEAAVLRQLRTHDFGEVTVFIQHGHPRRAVFKNSIILTELEGSKAYAEGDSLEDKIKDKLIK